MKMSKRVLALIATLVMVATMFSCAISVSAADAALDAELAALVRDDSTTLKDGFNVTNATMSGNYITTTKRNTDVTAVSKNTYNFFEEFTFAYKANYNYGVNAFNNEEHYTAIGDLKFAINVGVKDTETMKFKIYYGETVLATYDTGLTAGTDNVESIISSEWDPNVKYTITVNHGYVSVNSNNLGDITWTLADGETTTTSVALPEGYNFNGVNVTLFYDNSTSKNPNGWGQHVFLISEAKTYFPYDTVDALNDYLANIDPSTQADEIPAALALRSWACTDTSAELQAAITEVSSNYSHECIYEYTTTATCTEDGIRTYVCSICGASYEEAEAAFGHTETTSTANYTETTVCSVCDEFLGQNYLGREATYKLTSTDLDLKNTFAFSSNEFFVGDDVTPDGTVTGQTFTYTMDGIAVTGTINDISFELNGSLVHRVTGVTYTFTEAGKYYIYGTLTGVTDAEGNTYPDQKVQMGVIKVRDYISIETPYRGIKLSYGENGNVNTAVNLDDVVLGKTSTNAFTLTYNDVELDSIYYGDYLYANGWWKDYKNYRITIDGVQYAGYISRITYIDAFTGNSIGNQGCVWNGYADKDGTNKKVMSQTGVWYLYGNMEGLVCVEDITVKHDNVNNIPLGTINVTTYQGDTHIHDYDGKATKEPTCTETGIMHYTCECGEDDYYEDIAALGHNYGSEVTTEPTCKETGIETFTCTRCGDVYTETLDVVDHDYVAGYCRFCGIREVYTPNAAQWALKFVDDEGNVIDNVTTDNGEFWMVVSLTDYADLIGNMNKVTADGATDTINSTYDRTIAFATTLISMDGTKVVGVREDGKIVYSTPYEGATLITNYDSNDGLLKVVFQSDNNAGCDFSVGAADLAANDGELFRIKLTSTLEEAGEFDIKVVEQSALVSSSVALVNKPTAGAWETGISYTSALEFDVRGYDTIYNMAVEVEETPAEPVYDETFKPASVNVEFESDYTIRFTVKTAVYDMYNNVYMVVNKAMYDGDTAIESQVIELKNPAKVTVNGEERYAYIVEGFAAKEMSSQITATLCGEDENGNVVYGKAIEYSLRQYAQSQITKASTSAEFKTMMVDFLNYGAAAQIYFGYNTTDLANTNLTEEQLALGTADRELVKALAQTDSSTTRSKFSTVNLEFESKITIRATTNITGETYTANKDTWYAEAKYTNYLGEETIVTIPFSDARIGVDEKDRTYIAVNALAAREMSTPVEFTVYDGDGAAVTNTLTYSIETYAASKANGTNVELATLVKAMMKFGDGAKAYFEAE